MDRTEPFPFHLVIDVAAPRTSPLKVELVDRILDGLRGAACPLDARMVLVTFAERAAASDEMSVRELPRLADSMLHLGSHRSYAAAFDKVREVLITPGGAVLDGPVGNPALIVFVTDGRDDSPWEPAWERLLRTAQLRVVPIVTGVADPGLCRKLHRGPGVSPVVSRQVDVAAVVVDTVVTELGAVRAAQPVSGMRSELPTVLMSTAKRGAHRAEPAPLTATGSEIAALAMRPGVAPPPPHEVRPQVELDAEPVEPVAEKEVRQDVEPEWVGAFTPFAVGDPGRANGARPLPVPDEWDWRDTVCDGVSFLDADDQPLLDLRAASVRGSSHRFYGTARQDDYSYRRTADGRFVVCTVSDGVSSGQLSHRAATFVTRKGSELVAQLLSSVEPVDVDWTDLVGKLAAGVIGLGTQLVERERGTDDERPVTPKEVSERMAATVVFGVVDLRSPENGFPVHICSVGDSAAWVLRAGATWQPLTPVKNRKKDNDAAYATSTTSALPMLPTKPLVPRETTLAPDDILILMTDGIGDPLGDGDNAVGRFLATSWRQVPTTLEFAAHVDFARRTHDDDRTAVAVWPRRSR